MKSQEQTKQTQKLANRIRRLHDKKMTYTEISLKLGILTPEGKPNPGLVYKIGFEKYEPAGKEIRARLGLKDICISCLRSFRKPRAAAARSPEPWLSWWRRLSKRERDDRIRNQYEERN